MFKKVLISLTAACLLIPAAAGFSANAAEGTPVTHYVNNTSELIVYNGPSWFHSPMDQAYSGTVSYSNIAGEYAEYTFTGTNVSFIASKESNRGIVELFLDEQSVGEFDLYSETTLRQQIIYTAGDLEDDEHTVKAVVTGKQNPAAGGCYVDIDAFAHTKIMPYNITRYDDYDEVDKSIKFEGNWRHDTNSVTFGLYNRTFSYSNEAGSSAEITFTGIGIALYSSLEFNRGIADIYLDGELVKTVDLYSEKAVRVCNIYEVNGLANTTHTLKIVVKGEKNVAATDCFVDIDAFEILTALAQTVPDTPASETSAPATGDPSLLLLALSIAILSGMAYAYKRRYHAE